MNSYLFKSERLGFRNWTINDVDVFFTEINDDDDVMEFFPFKPSRTQTENFILRMQQMYNKTKFCYFAVDLLDTNELIGFIGLSEQSYIKELGTFVDIGWRLKKSVWKKGYATEGANACLKYGFEHLELKKIYSVASEININSIAVMKKIGMQQIKTFNHPKLVNSPNLVSCVLFSITV
ncbi:Protein N-acetyltransferase, RimJ/RimL family [Aquimarina amphilecti]|uniref:Protein N-acetyltransferase, RimJ/RimL family n=1 Tax=Aquimarina amphilecti TaxID=1038014 RepID=A0A1H7VVG2_AQUAM|nr:GNAT family N-acetyltransferase [Aquimarina amphilecti]SEM13170.1 Protein N-acetyltransferase, RimJ/RimL family [Aquimarina amphilecti]